MFGRLRRTLGNVPQIAAWVRFDGTGTPAIGASYNVSSITDLGPGNYRITFASPMPNANYAVFVSGDAAGSASVNISFGPSVITTTYVDILCETSVGSNVDLVNISVLVVC